MYFSFWFLFFLNNERKRIRLITCQIYIFYWKIIYYYYDRMYLRGEGVSQIEVIIVYAIKHVLFLFFFPIFFFPFFFFYFFLIFRPKHFLNFLVIKKDLRLVYSYSLDLFILGFTPSHSLNTSKIISFVFPCSIKGKKFALE